MKIRVVDDWPAALDLDPEIADAVFDRDRLAAALAALEAAPTMIDLETS